MRIIGIVQARMSSTRLPGKVLMPIVGQPMLALQMARLKHVKNVTEWVLATSTDPSDDILNQFATKSGLSLFRGELLDVLHRYHTCATIHNADAIVRVTADCPVIDPDVCSSVLNLFLNTPEIDYTSNTLNRTFPRGLDIEVFTMSALKRAYENAHKPEEREHVTLHMYTNPKLFKLNNYAGDSDYSQLRLTVDTQEDFELISTIYDNLYSKKPNFLLNDILTLFAKHPDLPMRNQHVQQKSLSK